MKTFHASAHCDVPCGIYDPVPAKIAARTVARMLDQMGELKSPDWNDEHAREAYLQSVARRVATKESHAEACKREIEILWSDFFKPEHLAKVPDLHDMVWKTLKVASRCKQENHAELGGELLAAVDRIAKAFYDAKGVPDRYAAYQEITDHLY